MLNSSVFSMNAMFSWTVYHSIFIMCLLKIDFHSSIGIIFSESCFSYFCNALFPIQLIPSMHESHVQIKEPACLTKMFYNILTDFNIYYHYYIKLFWPAHYHIWRIDNTFCLDFPCTTWKRCFLDSLIDSYWIAIDKAMKEKVDAEW